MDMVSSIQKLLNCDKFLNDYNIQAEFRGADFFPVEIFSKPNGDSNSVKNSESHDINFLT